MNNKAVNMHYRFTSDKEPTDRQLAVLMREVGEDVCRQSRDISKKLLENIEKEYIKAKKYYTTL